MAVDFSSRSMTISDIEHQSEHLEVEGDDDIVRGGKLIREAGFKVARMVDYVADAVEDALEDFDKTQRTRLGTLRFKAVVRGARIYAAGMRQADRVAKAMVNSYNKHYSEEIANARRKTRKTTFSPGGGSK